MATEWRGPGAERRGAGTRGRLVVGAHCPTLAKASAAAVASLMLAKDDEQSSEPAGIRRLLARESGRIGFRHRP